MEGGRRDSVVGIASALGLQSRGTNSGGGRTFSPSPRTAISSTQPPVQWAPALSRG
jgi:hypothetical protein